MKNFERTPRPAIGWMTRSTVAAVALLAAVSSSRASQHPTTVAMTPALDRDGRHGFDFLVGSWNVHHRRLRHPLAGAHDWYSFDGTCVMRNVMDFSNIDENVLHMPQGVVEGITVRLYNGTTHEWSLYWGTNKFGVLTPPPTVGKFDDRGVGRFYDHEAFNGKPIVVRYTWTHTTPNAAHWEQAFSPDGGKTWETNWVSDFTRT